MTAGMNCLVTFIRWVDADDDVGGNAPSGTVLHSSISARIEEGQASSLLLQQGLETRKVFSAVFWGHNLIFREQDEIIVTSPPNYKYYNKRFRVVSQTESSNHPAQKRNVYIAKLIRSQISHGEVYQ